MAYVVTENCIKCKYTDCVDVCPVDCFREGPNMLVIDPDECIDCTLCVPECPAEAIFAEDDVPDAQQGLHPAERRIVQDLAGDHRTWEPPADADAQMAFPANATSSNADCAWRSRHMPLIAGKVSRRRSRAFSVVDRRRRRPGPTSRHLILVSSLPLAARLRTALARRHGRPAATL